MTPERFAGSTSLCRLPLKRGSIARREIAFAQFMTFVSLVI